MKNCQPTSSLFTWPAKRTNDFSNRTYVLIRPTFLTLSLNKKFEATLTHDIYASINSSGAHPPPPGNHGAFAYFVSPGSWALAYPGATPGHLTHVFSKDG